MSFESLDRLLKAIASQPNWQEQRQYHQIVKCWQKVVDHRVAQHTRPVFIQRQILWVATSSPVWSQHLSFQRHHLVVQLNRRLEEKIVDIRFSPARWYQTSGMLQSDSSQEGGHPSTISIEGELAPQSQRAATPQEALQQWLEVIKRRSSSFPTCPRCQCPAPAGELRRWQVCAYCAAKDFSLP